MTIETVESTTPATRSGTGSSKGTAITVRARSTCEGAHVHVGSLHLRHDDVSEFAGRYQERPDASMLAKLTASAVNDIKDVLAPRFGLRIHRVEAAAICEDIALGGSRGDSARPLDRVAGAGDGDRAAGGSVGAGVR